MVGPIDYLLALRSERPSYPGLLFHVLDLAAFLDFLGLPIVSGPH
jgi:hypothetical protein